MRESERNLRLITENAGDVVFAYDMNQHLIYINPAFENLTGHSISNLRTNPFDDFLDRDDASRWRSLLEKAFRGESFAGEEFRIRTRDHSEKWCLSSGGPLLDSDRVQIGVQGRVHDITERKVAEEAVREAGRRKDEFLAMLSHELRNPLAPIRNGLLLLKNSADDGPNAVQVRNMVERQVEHLTRLVDDLLDLSRITRGRVDLRREQLRLAEVIDRAVEAARPMIDGRGHALEVSTPPEPILLDGDPIRLTQVLANLLNNAAKYTEPGGHIRLSAMREGDEAVIRVLDDGIGIAPDLLPNIFDSFVQADNSLDRSQGGLGLGLSLVKSLVELHGGSVSASSGGPNCGSEFVVRLPALCALADSPQSPNLVPRAKRLQRILVVDDNVDGAESLALLLELQGHQVRTAHDGIAAIDAISKFQPQVVLLDLGLPGMNGYEVARRVRSQPEFTDLVLAAVTGYGQDEDRHRSHEAGFNHHFVKPVDPKDLEAMLASAQ